MDTINLFNQKQKNIRKIALFLSLFIVVVIAAIAYGIRSDVKPTPAPVVDQITASNQQINVKEHQKADNKKKYADAEKIIQEQKAIQAQAQS